MVLAVPHLTLPAAPAGAADETSKGIDHWEAEFPSASWKNGDGFWTSRLHPRDSLVAFGGLHIGLWRSREEGGPAGAANKDGRWRGWTGDGFARVADGASTRTASQEMSDSNLLLGSWLLFTAGDSATPSSGPGAGWGHAALVRLTRAHSGSGKEPVCPFGVDCERARPLAGANPSKGIGASGFSVSGGYGLGVSLNDVHPYVRVTLTERLSVWWIYRF